jgi:polysaccharide chain length determinant protein (PEP-CTERM system associated)
MQEIITQIKAHIEGMWRYRWYAVMLAVPLCLVGWIAVQLLPDQYQATARVYLDTQSVLRPLLRGLAVDSNVRSEIDLMTKTLLSRPNLEKIARMTDLDLKAKTPDQMDELLDRLLNNIEIEQIKPVNQNLFKINYENSDPQIAKKVVQSLLTIFVETTLGESRKDTDVAQRFLDQQIKEYENRLVESENRLRDFKRKHIGRMPDEGKDYYQNLQAAIGDLEQAQMQLQEAENRRKELKRQLQDNASDFNFSVAPVAATATPDLDARIHNLQSRLDELLLKFTDQHPDVLAVKHTIEELEKQKKDVIAAQAKNAQNAADEGQTLNPYQAQLKLALSEAEANVAALTARVAARQQQVDGLKKLVNIIPEVETQLKQLNRDYDVTKSNYETLLARREAASLSDQMEQTSESVKFRVVDPPYVPPAPSGPNRPLLSTVTLLGSIGGGLAFAFFMAQLNPTFQSRRTLMEATSLPVLGGVSMIWTPAQLRKKRLDLWGFGASVALLLVCFGVVLTMQLLDIDPVAHLKAWL